MGYDCGGHGEMWGMTVGATVLGGAETILGTGTGAASSGDREYAQWGKAKQGCCVGSVAGSRPGAGRRGPSQAPEISGVLGPAGSCRVLGFPAPLSVPGWRLGPTPQTEGAGRPGLTWSPLPSLSVR